ncbi:protein gvpG [Halorarum halophilum]|uniref:Protein gvpG n=1 Tax=Halorarum halophilum TaxID=2743090 RepID=A0A7D5KNK6_9EURY|nr:protein gvpG [Halobaculum halophilum]QLG28562.1 protein gvpG [Halobaculum halophilum]
MTLIIDDLLFRPFVSILDIIHATAVQELYDVEALQADLKENQLLYELGERSQEEYERRKAELEADLDAAEAAREQLRSKQLEVRG